MFFVIVLMMILSPYIIAFFELIIAHVRKDRSICFIGPIPVVMIVETKGPGRYEIEVSPVFPIILLVDGFVYSVSPETRNGNVIKLSDALNEASKIAYKLWS